MNWEKLGLVYCAGGKQAWAQSHAFVPTAMMLDEEHVRVYAAFLDRERVGRLGFVDLDARNPLRVLRVADRPVLDIGVAGTFDENGLTPMCIVENEGRFFFTTAAGSWGRKSVTIFSPVLQ